MHPSYNPNTMDILDVTNESRPVEYFAQMYPGFPRFIHEIMYNIENGMTPEEAAAVSCDSLKDRLKSVINEVETTHAYMNKDGEIELPKAVQDYIDEHGIADNKPPELEAPDGPEDPDFSNDS